MYVFGVEGRPPQPPPPGAWHVLGLDLAQQGDFSALAVLEASPDPAPRYAVRHLHRWPLGTRYTTIVEDVKALAARPPLRHPALVIDGTGVGAAVVDMFAAAGMPARVFGVVITGGTRATVDESGRLLVPKRELVSVLQVLLQGRRLTVAADLPEARTLERELGTFRVKVSAAGNESLEAWRERDHDDTVLAVALAAWVAEQACQAGPGGGPEDEVMVT